MAYSEHGGGAQHYGAKGTERWPSIVGGIDAIIDDLHALTTGNVIFVALAKTVAI